MKATMVLAEALTPDGEPLMLITHDGEFFLKVRGDTLMSTTATESERLMAELACRDLGPQPRALIGGLGFGFTLRRTLECLEPGASVEVAELLPEIVAWNREFLREVNGALLGDPRVAIRIEDVCGLITAAPAKHYDALILDIDNGPDAFVQGDNDRLYSKAGLASIRRVLKPEGRAVFWSAFRDPAFVRRLQRAGFEVAEVAAKSYPGAKRPTHTLYIATHR